MERNEVNTRADAALVQPFDELRPADSEAVQVQVNRVNMEGVPAMRQSLRDGDLGQIGERLIEAHGDGAAALDERVQLSKLVNAQRRLDVGHVVLVPGLGDFVAPRTGGGVASATGDGDSGGSKITASP